MIIGEELDYSGACVYRIWSTQSNKKYIGKTINYCGRAKHHINALIGNYHGNPYLQRAYNKVQNIFYITPIEKCENNLLEEREKYWIDILNSYNSKFGYNLTKGGETTPDLLNTWTDERRKVYSLRCSEKPISKGVTRSETWRRKMKATLALKSSMGLVGTHLNKKCIVKNVETGEEKEYTSLKAASKENMIAYTYLTEKIKETGIATIRQFIIKKYE